MNLGAVIEKVVMMHRLRHGVFRACRRVQVHQLFGIELFGFPQLHDVLVPESDGCLMANVIAVLVGAFDVQVASIPVPVHRNRLGAPVRPDAQLSVPEPVRTWYARNDSKVGSTVPFDFLFSATNTSLAQLSEFIGRIFLHLVVSVLVNFQIARQVQAVEALYIRVPLIVRQLLRPVMNCAIWERM